MVRKVRAAKSLALVYACLANALFNAFLPKPREINASASRMAPSKNASAELVIVDWGGGGAQWSKRMANTNAVIQMLFLYNAEQYWQDPCQVHCIVVLHMLGLLGFSRR